MKNWGIVTKIVVVTCGIVSFLLLLGCFVLIMFEIKRENSVSAEYVEEIKQTIALKEQEEHALLEQQVIFNAEILSEGAARYLYDFDLEELKRSLPSYLRYHEILAIQVFNEYEEAVAAAWKIPDVRVGDKLPETLALNADLSVMVDSMFEGEKVGKFEVYYTDTLFEKKVQAVKEQGQTKIDAFYLTSRARLHQTIRYQIFGVVLILLVLVFCLMIFLRMLILRPLLKITRVTRQLADFNLTVSMKANTQDEIGRLFVAINEMVRSFEKVVSLVQHSGIQVTSSASELSATAKQQEATMQTQLESTHKVVRPSQEISDVATNLVETMQQVAATSQHTAKLASSGQANLSQMGATMSHMEGATKAISEKLKAINEKAENITTVVTTITGVADQTNLLSLNAAIEAEKAGEYGRGFAVVAREIRRLADQTAVATLNIEQMVKEMQAAVASGVMEMDKFIAEVRHSVEDVEGARAQLALIIKQVQTLSPRFEEVNVAMQQQSENARHINNAVVKLSEEMQQVKDSLYNTYSVIKQLNEAASHLQEEVSRFEVS